MSNDKNEPLFRLVKSFSKSEKKTFRLLNAQSGGDKKFIRLFDMLEKSNDYDERKIKKSKYFNPAQLPNLKIHLYGKLLTTLRYIESEKSHERKISGMIEDARLLYDRCLYPECLKMLDKAKHYAENYESSLQLFEIFELQKKALRLSVKENNEKRVNDVIQEINKLTERIHHVNSFSNLSLQLNSLYARFGFISNKEELAIIKQFFNRSLPKYNLRQMGFEEKLYFYYSFTGYYLFIRNFRQAHNYAKKWVELFDEAPEMKLVKTELYIKALNSLLVAQNKLYLINEFTETHRKLIAIKRDKSFKLTRNLNLHLFKAIYIHEMNRHFMLSEFKSGTRIVTGLQPELQNLLPLLDKKTEFLFYYKIACLYIGASNFKQCLHWLNKIIHEKDSNVRVDLQSFARILSLICYFELNDDDGVQYNIKSTYRFLLRKSNFNQFENLIIQFLKNLKGNETNKELKQRFIALKADMEKIMKLPFEKRAFIYFDMISWLESKIQNRPIQEMVKERIGQGIKYNY